MARYWPEFGEHGKHELLVRHVVSHMSGQPSFRAPVSADALADDVFVESVVASDEPWWAPNTQIAYQSITYGALCGGLIRRIAGESTGTFVRREIAEPLGLDLWIGLPEEREQDVAPLQHIPVDEQGDRHRRPGELAQVENPRDPAQRRMPSCGTPAPTTRPRSRGPAASRARRRSRGCTPAWRTAARSTAGSCCGPRPSSSGARRSRTARRPSTATPCASASGSCSTMATARGVRRRASSGTRATAARPPAPGPSGTPRSATSRPRCARGTSPTRRVALVLAALDAALGVSATLSALDARTIERRRLDQLLAADRPRRRAGAPTSAAAWRPSCSAS